MTRHKFEFALAVVAALLFLSHQSNNSFAQSAKSNFRDAPISNPQEFLGFKPGTDRTIADWRQITSYFEKLDQASASVRVETIGKTTLDRPLIVAYISAPENIRELNKFKGIQRKLANPRMISDAAERGRLLRDGKTIVAISCSIHSTEIVSSQMSMQLAFDLATAHDNATKGILKNTILLLIPSVNPDGIDIVADWYRKTLGTEYEGTNPPELYHHYAGHDNNRDWFMLNLRETQLVTRLFWKEWFPEIVYDIHQQSQVGPRFFIPPFYDPANPNIHPRLIREIGLLGSKVAADLEAAHFAGVITSAQFDMWWHGGLRTSPYYHNSIGILSEAASAKLMTPVDITREQLAASNSRGMPSALQSATNYPNPWPAGMWRPGDIMAMEMSAARSVLTMAAKFRIEYLRNFVELNQSAESIKPTDENELAYLIEAGQGNDETVARLIEVLLDQGIEVFRMSRELHMKVAGTVGGDYLEVPLGSYLIFLSQPARWNVKALFERQVYPDRRGPTGEAEPPYDVAGWTLPMQMGIETSLVASIREYPDLSGRIKLVQNASEVRRHLGLALRHGESSPIPNPIRKPVRLALYKGWTSSIDEGWTRWLFETFHVPYESLRDNAARDGHLRDRFDVIVLSSQRSGEIIEGNASKTYPEEFTGGITKDGVENLRRFVEDGGTLICFDAACELAIKQFSLPLRNVLDGVQRTDFYCPGSIIGLDVDVKDPFAKGLRERVDAYFINSSAFEATDATRVRVAARYSQKDLLRSGWLIGEGRIAGRIALANVTLGKGNVILFGFRPQHRGQTWGTFPFIFNAIESGAR